MDGRRPVQPPRLPAYVRADQRQRGRVDAMLAALTVAMGHTQLMERRLTQGTTADALHGDVVASLAALQRLHALIATMDADISSPSPS